MKKLIFLVVIIALLSGCSLDDNRSESEVASSSSRFQYGDVGRHANGVEKDFHYVLTDKSSYVQYLVVTPTLRNSSAGVATTVIIDKDGKPYIEIDKARGSDSERFVSSNMEVSKSSEYSGEMYQYVLTDQVTNIQYLVVVSGRRDGSAGISITPMFGADGKPLQKSCGCTIQK